MSTIGLESLAVWMLTGMTAALVLGFFMSQIHLWLPEYFPKEAEFPYTDALTTTFSVIATILLIKRKLECWLFWFVVDVLAIYIYYQRGIYLVSLEYFIFLCIVVYGYINWRQET